ncbi:GNAT family N-acetyltransferase, partial [Serratia marcescens]
MKECHIEISDRVTPEITSCIAEGLDRFNDQQIGYGDRLPLAVVVKDPDSGDVLGGITGRSSLGLLFLDLFYL